MMEEGTITRTVQRSAESADGDAADAVIQPFEVEGFSGTRSGPAVEPPSPADLQDELTHGAKVKRGQLSAVQRGRYGTGPAPYGYRRGKGGDKRLLVEDREAEVVRTIFREYLRTRSTGKVVEYLHAKKIYTRKGNKWSRQAIAIILSNRTYRGRVCYGEVETEGLHNPIIEPALFYKANSLKDRKKRSKKRPASKFRR